MTCPSMGVSSSSTFNAGCRFNRLKKLIENLIEFLIEKALNNYTKKINEISSFYMYPFQIWTQSDFRSAFQSAFLTYWIGTQLLSGGRPRASKYVCKRQHISESETSSLRKIAFFLPFRRHDNDNAWGERRGGELEHVVFFTRVFKDPAMRELIKELCQWGGRRGAGWEMRSSLPWQKVAWKSSLPSLVCRERKSVAHFLLEDCDDSTNYP